MLGDSPIGLSDEQPLVVRSRMLTDNPTATPIWRTVAVQNNGAFSLDTMMEQGKSMLVQAWFDRTDRLCSSMLKEIILKQGFLEYHRLPVVAPTPSGATRTMNSG